MAASDTVRWPPRSEGMLSGGGDSAQWGGTATSHRTLPSCRADLYHIYLSNLLSLRIEHFTFFPKEESSDKSGPLWNKRSLRPTCEGSNNEICDIFKLYIQTLKEERQPLHNKKIHTYSETYNAPRRWLIY